jgi:hypothetical protein
MCEMKHQRASTGGINRSEKGENDNCLGFLFRALTSSVCIGAARRFFLSSPSLGEHFSHVKAPDRHFAFARSLAPISGSNQDPRHRLPALTQNQRNLIDRAQLGTRVRQSLFHLT